MGAPATTSNNPINFDAPRIAANSIFTPQQSVSDMMGFLPSQYSGLDSIPNTNYFYGNGNVYETYNVPPQRYGYRDQFGNINYADQYGQAGFGGNPNTDASGNFILNPGSARYNIVEGGEVEGTIYRDGQAFRPVVDADVPGFVKSGGKLEPSMAYLYANRPQPIYEPVANQMSFLSSPTMPSYNGNFGAGRFINTGNLLGFNFGTPNGQTTGGETTS